MQGAVIPRALWRVEGLENLFDQWGKFFNDKIDHETNKNDGFGGFISVDVCPTKEMLIIKVAGVRATASAHKNPLVSACQKKR